MDGNDSNQTSSAEAAVGVNWPGLASIVVFYSLVLAVGIWAAWRQRKALRALGRSPTGGQGRNTVYLNGSYRVTMSL